MPASLPARLLGIATVWAVAYCGFVSASFARPSSGPCPCLVLLLALAAFAPSPFFRFISPTFVAVVSLSPLFDGADLRGLLAFLL